MSAKLNIIGLTFGQLKVLSEASDYFAPCGVRQRRSLCECSCGKTCIVSNRDLRSGHTKSCGCVRAAASRARWITHGKRHTRVYNIWAGMMQRCTNQNCQSFDRYGGRGLDVFPEWHAFEPFLAFMGPGKNGWSIHRVDNDAGYFPENMVWATAQFQNWHKSNVRIVTVGGVTGCLAELCERFAQPYARVYQRLRLGWSVEKAMFAARYSR